MLSYVKKRSGELRPFDAHKLRTSILRAMKDVSHKDESEKVLNHILNKMSSHKLIFSTSDLRDIVEDSLIELNMKDIAKSYAIFKKLNLELKEFIKTPTNNISHNALIILSSRYLKRNKEGKIIENPDQLFHRVANYIASAEKKNLRKKYSEEFYKLLNNLDFLPNTPCLANANTLNQLAACFVLDIPDSLEGIYDSLKKSAQIFQSGGGVGYSFSHIRPKNSIISSTGRFASGPVSFMHLFDKSCDVIKQGGIRRGANMGILNINHPDIFEFISEKSHGSLQNFNLSIAITDDFMHSVINNSYSKIGKNKLRSREIFDYICTNAWQSGDPGLIFIDEINKKHSLNKLGKIESTNPYDEIPLLSNESCVLGSINLSHMIHNKHIDWPKLANTIELSIRFLDNVVTINKYPTKEIEIISHANRKIGLGVMGWADMLLELGIKYDSEEAIDQTKELMSFLKKHAELTSEKLAKEKGIFPNFHKSNLKKKRRNATLLSIAPTGSISLIANCSSGIEPLFAISYVRKALGGLELFESNKSFENIARYHGFYSKELMLKISQTGSIKEFKEIPKDIKNLFVTALDISLEWHIKIQSVFQAYVDNSVSKTINLPNNATIGDIKRAYMLAWKSKCKGITVYRYGSKDSQILNIQKQTTISDDCNNKECNF